MHQAIRPLENHDMSGLDVEDNRRILIVTDAWRPQVNGVVRTLEATAQELTLMGHDVHFLTPADFHSLPCPTYPEIRLSLARKSDVARRIAAIAPDYIHISTEGPLGIAARRYCLTNGFNFTTAYHTKFPDYIKARFGIPIRWTYAFIRWFHQPSQAIMCATPSVASELGTYGLAHSYSWSRGVDVDLFTPSRRLSKTIPAALKDLPKPILLYVGRIAVEKNIEDFLNAKVPGTKVVVGGGPQLEDLRARYPDALFIGPQFGEDLANIYAASDVFVFPSKTDTFGLVLLEALASGTPVAAYPVTGPIDVIGKAAVGCLDNDLDLAIRRALSASRTLCRTYAMQFSWRSSAQQFLGNLVATKINQIVSR